METEERSLCELCALCGEIRSSRGLAEHERWEQEGRGILGGKGAAVS
jgi:hypothetical protein